MVGAVRGIFINSAAELAESHTQDLFLQSGAAIADIIEERLHRRCKPAQQGLVIVELFGVCIEASDRHHIHACTQITLDQAGYDGQLFGQVVIGGIVHLIFTLSVGRFDGFSIAEG